MKNLATKNTTDFTVLEDGQAFISQRKAAELLGVNPSTLMKHISRQHQNTNTINGLDAKTLQTVSTYYAYKSRTPSKKAEALCEQLMQAGAKAYIYHQAGYKIDANVEPKPLSRIELAEQNLKLTIEVEDARLAAKKAEQDAIDRLNRIGNHLAGSTISELGDNLTFNMAAKLLSSNLDCKLGHNDLMRLCRDHGWLMTGERSTAERNKPTQKKMHHFMMKLFTNPNTGRVHASTVLKPSGVAALSKLIPLWVTAPKRMIPGPPTQMPLRVTAPPTPIALPALPALPVVRIPTPDQFIHGDRMLQFFDDCENKNLHDWQSSGWSIQMLISDGEVLDAGQASVIPKYDFIFEGTMYLFDEPVEDAPTYFRRLGGVTRETIDEMVGSGEITPIALTHSYRV